MGVMRIGLLLGIDKGERYWSDIHTGMEKIYRLETLAPRHVFWDNLGAF